MIEIVRNINEFESLESDWNSLLEKSGLGNIFLSFDWLFTWWKHCGRSGALLIIIVKENNTLLGIAPLMLMNVLGVRQLRFIGRGISDYEDIITSGDKEERERIIRSIFNKLSELKEWDIFRLERLKQNSPHYAALMNIRMDNFCIYSEKHFDGAPYLETSCDRQLYYSGLSKKFLADTKRQKLRLFKDAKGAPVEKISDRDELEKLLEELIAFHISRRKSQDSKSMFEDLAVRGFLKEATLKFFEEGILDFSVIRNNGTIAAMHLGFIYQNKFFYYLPVYNEDFQKYSIGRLLLAELIERSFNEGISEFDFMIGEEKYKDDWNPKIEPLYRLNIYPRTMRGIVADMCLNRFNIGVKRLLGKKW